jgi:2-C-methyl-D-erythritol 2,4-cyclodiphosphate synthase
MLRIGYGIDVHALVDGRPLIIGGILIPFEKGLAGHSDADVLMHAVCDALLGAAGFGDIGRWFPDSDEQYKDIDSSFLLERVVSELHDRGYSIVNIDATILAEAPKLSPYIEQMREKLALILQIDTDRINIKATTTEGLGFAGRGEGIEARAVCLIAENHP